MLATAHWNAFAEQAAVTATMPERILAQLLYVMCASVVELYFWSTATDF